MTSGPPSSPAYDIVSKCGGEIKAQYVLWSDNCLLSIVDYPTISAFKSQLAIARRGAFRTRWATGPTDRGPPLVQGEVKVIAGR